MDSLFLLQFACFLFVSINAIILGITRLQIKWMNRRYEKSRWLIFAAMVGLALQFLAQMGGGISGERRRRGSHIQHAGLSSLLHAHRHGHLQYRGYARQPPKDERRLCHYLCRHTRYLRRRL